MRLTHWAAAPHASPPPIPLSTDAVSASNRAYRVGAIPPAALADDLAAAGLTYSPGRGNGYRRNGDPIDSYLVGDVIAETFSEAHYALAYYIATDPIMCSIAADFAALDRLPRRDRDVHENERRQVRARLHSAERALSLSYAELDLASQSLAATSRLIRGFPTSRDEAVRRFRSVLPASPRPASSGLGVDEFLASVAPGPIARPDLHAAALAAGVVVGSRTLYAAADALGWPSANRRGVRRYRVPERP